MKLLLTELILLKCLSFLFFSLASIQLPAPRRRQTNRKHSHFLMFRGRAGSLCSLIDPVSSLPCIQILEPCHGKRYFDSNLVFGNIISNWSLETWYPKFIAQLGIITSRPTSLRSFIYYSASVRSSKSINCCSITMGSTNQNLIWYCTISNPAAVSWQLKHGNSTGALFYIFLSTRDLEPAFSCITSGTSGRLSGLS